MTGVRPEAGKGSHMSTPQIHLEEDNNTDVDLDQEVVLDGHGKRITEADAEALAEEIIGKTGGRGGARPGAGRPSLNGKSGQSSQIVVRMPDDLQAQLAARAAAAGVTVSLLVREIARLAVEGTGALAKQIAKLEEQLRAGSKV
jgi:plasmid stability protein